MSFKPVSILFFVVFVPCVSNLSRVRLGAPLFDAASRILRNFWSAIPRELLNLDKMRIYFEDFSNRFLF